MNKTKCYMTFLLLFSIFFSCTVIDDNSDNTFRIWYDNKLIQPDENTFTIDLFDNKDISDIKLTLEVEEGAILQDGNNKDLPLNKDNQYIITIDFSGGKKHIFKVTTQDGNVNIYTIRAETGSEEIFLFQNIIENGVIPNVLTGYDDMSKQIFSRYTVGAKVVARYIKETTVGTGDGSSWDNAGENIRTIISSISDASANKIYVILIASGTYEPITSYVMKNHIALIGGFTAGSYEQAGKTRLNGNGSKRVFANRKGIGETALLYGVVITNGHAIGNHGGGMYNDNASPTLINITFSDNEANQGGGGMYNNDSSPTLINVAFLNNKADKGGGMYNNGFSPILNNVTFSDNEANYGGGIHNRNSSPTLINVTLSGNTANNNNNGGGMYNEANSSPTLINITFSDNTGNKGGGIYNNNSSSTLINVTFSGNTADYGGGISHNGDGKQLTLINTILWGNDNGNIHVLNDSSDTETVNLYYSLIEGDTSPSVNAVGISLKDGDTSANPIHINTKSVIADNPLLGTLTDNEGGINTISIGSSSPAKDRGIYVKWEASLYYSMNNINWFSDPSLNIPDIPPNDAADLTATDARGYSRIGRPDMGAYEVGISTP